MEVIVRNFVSIRVRRWEGRREKGEGGREKGEG